MRVLLVAAAMLGCASDINDPVKIMCDVHPGNYQGDATVESNTCTGERTDFSAAVFVDWESGLDPFGECPAQRAVLSDGGCRLDTSARCYTEDGDAILIVGVYKWTGANSFEGQVQVSPAGEACNLNVRIDFQRL